MSDWDEFKEYIPWFIEPTAVVRKLQPQSGFQLHPSVAARLPALSTLLAQSSMTLVVVNEIPYQLFAWDKNDGGRFGWLCAPPHLEVVSSLHPTHTALLLSFGGIIERFNEPEDTWLLNHTDALTSREASHDASFINEYMWAFEDAGATLPIQPSEFYSIAREANGNTTLCHRTTGQVILFAADHAFDFVTALEGCPEYTLYKINGAATLDEWIEVVASQWLSHVAKPT